MPIDFSKYKKKQASELQATTETHIPKEAIFEPEKSFISENIEKEKIEPKTTEKDTTFGYMNKSAKLNYLKFSYALLTQKSTTNLKKDYMKKVVSGAIKEI